MVTKLHEATLRHCDTMGKAFELKQYGLHFTNFVLKYIKIYFTYRDYNFTE